MATIVLDNGAGVLRGGFAGEATPRRCMPNCTARLKSQMGVLAGDETEDAVRDKSQITFQRPHDRGYLIHWETQLEVWQRMFGHLNVASPSDHALVFTEPPFAPALLSQTADEVLIHDLYHAAAGCLLCELYVQCSTMNMSVDLYAHLRSHAHMVDTLALRLAAGGI